MDTLKAEALKQGRWRLGEDGYIEKGPFPKDKTTVNVSVVGNQPDTGATILSLTPRHAGESPVVVYAEPAPRDSVKDSPGRRSRQLHHGGRHAVLPGPRDHGPLRNRRAGSLDRRAQDPSPGGASRRQAPRHLACTPKADI
jgi:hypothetical protein